MKCRMGYDGKLVRIYTEAAAGFSRFKYPTLIMRYLIPILFIWKR